MRVWASLAAALLAGCATTPVVLPDDLPPEQWDVAQEALGVPMAEAELEHEGVGQIVVHYLPELTGCQDAPLAVGCAMRREICKVRVEIKHGAPVNVLAHEIGHGLILTHSPDAPHNVMATPTTGTNAEMTEEQRMFMRLGAEYLRACRRIARRRAKK